MQEEKVYLTRAWRKLSSELDLLLQNEDFLRQFKGSAPKLSQYLEAMEIVSTHAVVPLNEEVLSSEQGLLK